MGRVASDRGGELVLDHGPDLRRWDEKIIGNPSSLGPISRSGDVPDRAFESDHRWGSAPFRLGIGGLRRLLRTIPTNRHGVISFAAAGAEGGGCSNHVSMDSSRGRFGVRRGRWGAWWRL